MRSTIKAVHRSVVSFVIQEKVDIANIKMIKLAIIACAVLVVNCEITKTSTNFSTEKQAKLLEAFNKCSDDKDYIAEALGIVGKGEYRDDPKFKSLIYCATKEFGYCKPDGRIYIEKTVELFPAKDKEIMRNMLTECDKQIGSPEENCFYTFKCFQQNSKYAIKVKQ